MARRGTSALYNLFRWCGRGEMLAPHGIMLNEIRRQSAMELIQAINFLDAHARHNEYMA
jgi:hypothetical protein